MPPKLRNNCAVLFYNIIVGKNESITADRERYATDRSGGIIEIKSLTLQFSP